MRVEVRLVVPFECLPDEYIDPTIPHGSLVQLCDVVDLGLGVLAGLHGDSDDLVKSIGAEQMVELPGEALCLIVTVPELALERRQDLRGIMLGAEFCGDLKLLGTE